MNTQQVNQLKILYWYGHGIGEMPWMSKSMAFPNSSVADRKGIRAIKTPLQLQDSDVMCFGWDW